MPVDLHELISCIASALDARDSTTALHSERVSAMVQETCLLLGVPEKERATIHIAAHLHDIGKIGIPDAVLLKSDRLTQSEWEILRRHPDIGADILLPVTGFSMVSQLIRYHHERYDGLGYPAGLVGEHIPYGARIIAICDSIDAMLSKRNYRDAMNMEYCLSEIRKNLGTMYDPVIGEVVLAHWEEILLCRG